MSESSSSAGVDLRYVALVIVPVVVVYMLQFSYMQSNQLWGLFRTDWYMTVTMVAGSFIAGASSEGGGAIAYPVMTLVFDIDPAVARNFSLAIQSIGMMAASLWIIARKVPIGTIYLWWVALGGIPGIIGGT